MRARAANALYLGLRVVRALDDPGDGDDNPDPDDDGEACPMLPRSGIPEDDASKRPALTVVHGMAA